MVHYCFRAPSESEYPADATIKANKFAIRDFVVGTTTAVFANVRTDGTDVTVSISSTRFMSLNKGDIT